MTRILATIIIVCSSILVQAQGTINTMFYNIYRYPSATPYNRENALREILVDYMPDLLMVCELESEVGLNKILNTSFGYATAPYGASPFRLNQSNPLDTLQQAVFYNKNKLMLVKDTFYQTNVRDINRYTFVLNTNEIVSDSVFLEVFVTHLKSSDSRADRLSRDSSAMVFQEVLRTLPSDRAVLFAGDFNFYRSTEPAYIRITDTTNAIKMVDPIGTVYAGNWQDNASMQKHHTQATRTSRTGFGIYGATGGLDDRFDFIMMSNNLQQNQSRLSYVNNTYAVFGNNGNCLNMAIKDQACTGLYGQTLRQLLHDMSDHLPVVMQLRTAYSFQNNTTHIDPTNMNQAWHIVGKNVVSDQLLVRIPNDEQGEIYIINTLGQILQQQTMHSGTNLYQFNVASLPNGIYMVKHSNSNVVKRFIKE